MIRHPRQYWVGLVVMAAGTIAAAFGFYAAAPEFVVFGAAFTVLCYFVNVRPRLIWGQSDVVVINVRSRRLARRDIVGVSTSRLWTGSTAVALRLRGGTSVPCLGCATIGRRGDVGLSWVRQTAQRLNSDLRRR